MIEAICNERKHVFIAPVILGLSGCPKCGSENTSAVVYEEAESPDS